MKKKFLISALILVFALEIAGVVYFLSVNSVPKQDNVAVNDIVQTVTAHWEDLDVAQLPAKPHFTVVNSAGKVIYSSREGLSNSLNEAIAGRDTILDVETASGTAGKIFIHNDSGERLSSAIKGATAVFLTAFFIQALLCIVYYLYIKRTVFRPFSRLKDFALRVAGGNLDLPLDMDRHNVFGAFTESFDILRAELKAARSAEAAANRSKKELVAKLSHDIKTPVASIKSVSELGGLTAPGEKEQRKFLLIEEKSDQIDALISNLFQATLEDLQQLSVNPATHQSAELFHMLKKADYMSRAAFPDFPNLLISFDALRLQQVFDNIISNSYKYAGTDIAITAGTAEDSLLIRIADSGGVVHGDDLPFLFEKFRRGRNAEGKDGAGLGLYISRYLMGKMDGDIAAENTGFGLAVTVTIKMSGI